MNSTVKTVLFWLVILASCLVLWQVVKAGSAGPKEREISYSEFVSRVQQGDVESVTINGTLVQGKFRNNKTETFRTTLLAQDQDMAKILRDKSVVVNVKDASAGNWGTWVMTFSPFILFGVLWFIMIRQMKTGG